ncbi:MAG: glyoxalase, partial [Deltaproteobacteria bacterium]|nr:glyoxalase [Deltaproteobacteria bacterium]
DIEAARARVAQAGFDVSGIRPGAKPGTSVCSVRGEPLGVATLLIGPGDAEPAGSLR